MADQYVILDVNDAMADYNAGDTSLVTADVYSKLSTRWKAATPF